MHKDINKMLGKVIGTGIVVAGVLGVSALIVSSKAVKTIIEEFSSIGKTVHDVTKKEKQAEIILHEINIEEE